MSMLTGQADELRKAALIQGAHARYDVANLLTDAADTIISLRDRAQDLQAENAKLREIASDLYSLVMHEDIYVRYPLSDEFDKIMNQIETSMREMGIEVTA